MPFWYFKIFPFVKGLLCILYVCIPYYAENKVLDIWESKKNLVEILVKMKICEYDYHLLYKYHTCMKIKDYNIGSL